MRLAILCFVLAVVAAVFGFGGIAASLVWIGKIAFVIFAAIFVLSLAAHAFQSLPGA